MGSPLLFFGNSIVLLFINNGNNRKTMGTMEIGKNIAQLIGPIILSPQTKFGVIISTIAHLMVDFVSCKYKGKI